MQIPTPMKRSTNSPAALPREFSLYLDLLRFGAAVMVLLFHVKKFQVGPAEVLRFIPDRGHDFVILFFVLSGYVIASAADRKRAKGWREFALDRMARVYSVAVPLLLFCTLLSVFLHSQIDPQRNWANGIDHPYLILGLNLVFLGQSWWLHLMPFLNDPYWSLCYEVMYYAAFGVFMFVGGWGRVLGLVVVAAVAGPKILLLLPCWLFGVAAYFCRDRWPLGRGRALLIAFVVPVAMLLALHAAHFAPTMRAITKDWFATSYDALDFSQDFLVDYVAAVLASIHLYAIRYLAIRWPVRLGPLITSGAAMSFTLYLFHMPLIFLVMNAYGESRSGVASFLTAAIGVPLVCYGISRVTEARRGAVRQWLDRMLPGSSSSAAA